MSSKTEKTKCSRFFTRLTGRNLRIPVIEAGFPYHKSPHLYRWLWVFILLPFLEQYTLNDLSENYGRELRKLYVILMRHPKAFEKLLRLLALPVFFELLSEFDASDDTAKSRKRPMLIVDDTKSEKIR
ncbi:MAG: hypothetical protein GY749_03825 [Desulfobacteraceae bacterium]|nr:hypothetical protein [Desulfobacteraceae bacterium]